MRRIISTLAVGAALMLVVPSAHALGVSAKAKAKQIQGALVPAHSPADTGPSTGDDENDSPALQDTAVRRGTNCTFEQGQYKFTVGKDGQAQVKSVICGGVPADGIQLCAHAKALSAIMNEEIDKTGASTPKTCTVPSGNIAGANNWVSVNVGTLDCKKGTCKGTLPAVATDPCPDVDKVTEYRRIEVFDGAAKATASVLGTNLSACCGPGQTYAGSIPVSGHANCIAAPGQDVFAESGTIVQGVAP